MWSQSYSGANVVINRSIPSSPVNKIWSWEVLAFTLPLIATYITLVKYMGGKRRCTYVHMLVHVCTQKIWKPSVFSHQCSNVFSKHHTVSIKPPRPASILSLLLHRRQQHSERISHKLQLSSNWVGSDHLLIISFIFSCTKSLHPTTQRACFKRNASDKAQANPACQQRQENSLSGDEVLHKGFCLYNLLTGSISDWVVFQVKLQLYITAV